MSATTVWQALALPPGRFLLGAWPWRALGYLLLSAAIALVLLPVLLLSLLLLPLWGLVVGAMERRRTRVLGFPRQASGHVPLARNQRHIWFSVRLSEAASWREAAAVIVDLVLGLLALVLLVVEALTLTVLGVLGTVGATDGADVRFFSDVRAVVSPANWWLVIPIGLLAILLSAYLNALLAGVQASALRGLCGPRHLEITRAVERLTQSRAALVAAFEAERRRIERDLHDGVQQELVTLAARLGLVSLEIDELTARGGATAEARMALDAAQDQAEHAMAALRDTVRGIHPAVLSDHGLRAALNELAERTPVPLSLDVAELGRLPAATETAAYYLVTEAISNAAKHTAASRVSVHAAIEGGALALAVTDDGHGGADEERGTGLRGLRERAETLGGRFAVVSPPGGPTILRLALPVTSGEERRDASAAG